MNSGRLRALAVRRPLPYIQKAWKSKAPLRHCKTNQESNGTQKFKANELEMSTKNGVQNCNVNSVHSKSNGFPSSKSLPLYNVAECHCPTGPSRLFGALQTSVRLRTASRMSMGVQQQRVMSTFVSSHYQFQGENGQDVAEYLDRKHLTYRTTSNEFSVRECPFCKKPHKNDPTNLWKLYISRENGAYICFRCGSQGSWFDFKRRMGDLRGSDMQTQEVEDKPVHVSRRTVQAEELRWQTAFDDLVGASRGRPKTSLRPFVPALSWLTGERNLSLSTLKAYRVGLALAKFEDTVERERERERERDGEKGGEREKKTEWRDHVCVVFPMVREDGSLARLKLRAYDDKRHQRMEKGPHQWGLFGMHLVKPEDEEIILTEGEFDAMSVYQSTGKPALSLPNGCRSLPVDILPMLERFRRVYLWMDDDIPGQEGARQFALKLGKGRCRIVSSRVPEKELMASSPSPADGESGDSLSLSLPHQPKDANEALARGFDLKKMLESAQGVPHNRILTFSDLRLDIHRELENPDQVAGVRSAALPSLNRTLKGLRRGELTIFTGATGVGKTTILSQLSLDWCQRGVSTLWGSFEIPNTRLAKRMLSQLAAKALEEAEAEEFAYWADKFQTLPMWFMRFYGSTNVDQVLDAMEYSVYRNDVQHIILDNLQFMVSGQGRGFERFDHMDAALEKFRKFATTQEVHITLVIHPRKQQDDDTLIGLSSVFGTAKATQEADNVIVVQKSPAYRFLELKKNRFDGTLGRIPYRFDSASQKIYELSDEEVKQLESEAAQSAVESRRRRGYSNTSNYVGGNNSSTMDAQQMIFNWKRGQF